MSSRFGLILNAEMCLCELQRMQFSYPMADEGGDRETFDVISMVPALARSLFSSAAIDRFSHRSDSVDEQRNVKTFKRSSSTAAPATSPPPPQRRCCCRR